MEVTLIDNDLTTKEYIDLCIAVGFYESSLEQAEKGLKHSLLTVKALCDGQVVGMGRIIGDGAIHWFLHDICVLPEYQGLGIGKKIVNRLVEFVEKSGIPGTRASIQLMAAKGKDEFYHKLGFISRPNEQSGPGMQKRFIV